MNTNGDMLSSKTTRFMKRQMSILLTALMMGVSNVILEENRSVNDTSNQIELPEQKKEERP